MLIRVLPGSSTRLVESSGSMTPAQQCPISQPLSAVAQVHRGTPNLLWPLRTSSQLWKRESDTHEGFRYVRSSPMLISDGTLPTLPTCGFVITTPSVGRPSLIDTWSLAHG